MYDPMNLFGRPENPLAGLLPRSKAPSLQPITPEEEEGLLSQLGGKVMGGVGYIGSSLDKAFGGRAVRGVLGGKAQEALSLIPFSDALGITNEANKVEGKDLLDQWGVINKNDDSWLNTGLGIAADMALDPGTYLTFGGAALSPLGRSAAKAGVLPGKAAQRLGGLAAASPEAAKLAQATGKTVAEVAGQRLGGHVGIGLPFSDPFATLDMTGPMSLAKDAGKLASKIPGVGGLVDMAGAVKDGLAPAGRSLRALFDPEVRGQVSARGQDYGRLASKYVNEAETAARGEIPQVMRAMGGDIDSGQELRYLVEKSMTPAQARPGVVQAAPLVEQQFAADLAAKNEWGIPTGEVQDYFHRKAVDPTLDLSGGGGKFSEAAIGDAAMAHREKIFDVPGKTQAINQMFMDPAIRSAPDVQSAARHLAGTYNVPQEQAVKLADMIRQTDPSRVDKGLFTRAPLQDFQEGRLGAARSIGTARAAHETMASAATTVDKAGPMAVPVSQVLSGAGLIGENAGKKQLEMLVNAGIVPAQQAAVVSASPTAIKQLLDGLYVPRDVADAVTRVVPAFTTPQVLKPLVDFADSATNLLKGSMTSPWLSFNVRNLVSGMWQTFVAGVPINQMPKVYGESRALISGKVVDSLIDHPWFKNMNPADATKALSDAAFQHGVLGSSHLTDVVAEQGIENVMKQLPGLVPRADSTLGALGTYAKEIIPRTREQLNPLNMAGIGGRTEAKFAPVAAGRKLGDDFDALGRMASFIGLGRQGYSPEMAAMMTRASHIDYSALTPFEKQVMRRVAPFYTWSRRNLPYQLEQVITKPGGVTSQALQGTAQLEQDKGFVPEYLSKGIAIPLGEQEDGKQRFLSSLGLPIEDLGQFVSPMGVGRTGEQFLSNLNPMLKAPLEFFTGKQFYSGRELADLGAQGLTGMTPVDHLLMNSPLSRVLTASRTLADERKGPLDKFWNLATGAKVTDVDMERQKDLAIRDYIERYFQGNPNISNFERLGIRQGALPNLSPEEVALMQLYQAQQRRMLEEAKQRKLLQPS